LRAAVVVAVDLLAVWLARAAQAAVVMVDLVARVLTGNQGQQTRVQVAAAAQMIQRAATVLQV
jgi:hypothetical protein